jgi:hypothetical protein
MNIKCFLGLHDWKSMEYKEDPYIDLKLRKCQRCGKEEVYNEMVDEWWSWN